MAPLDFEILSKLMRYVFTVLGVLILWRSYAWLIKDRQANHKRLKALPDAGTIGVLTVLRGSSELEEGSMIPVPAEGVLGFVRTCDVVVPVTDVVAQHLDFTFRNGKGLYIYPRRGCPAAVDGVTLDSRADSHRYPMHHGSLLEVGEALLQLGVFAGLEVEQASGLPEEDGNDPDSAPWPPAGPYYPLPPYPPQNSAYPPQSYPQQTGVYPPATCPSQNGSYPPPAYPPQNGPWSPQAGAYPPQSPPWQPVTPPQRRPGDDA